VEMLTTVVEALRQQVNPPGGLGLFSATPPDTSDGGHSLVMPIIPDLLRFTQSPPTTATSANTGNPESMGPEDSADDQKTTTPVMSTTPPTRSSFSSIPSPFTTVFAWLPPNPLLPAPAVPSTQVSGIEDPTAMQVDDT
jgi:hypothetical protein